MAPTLAYLACFCVRCSFHFNRPTFVPPIFGNIFFISYSAFLGKAKIFKTPKGNLYDCFLHCETIFSTKNDISFAHAKFSKNPNSEFSRRPSFANTFFLSNPKLFVHSIFRHSVPRLCAIFTNLRQKRTDSRLSFGILIFMEKKYSSIAPPLNILNLSAEPTLAILGLFVQVVVNLLFLKPRFVLEATV